jgi:hypothetical protein
VTTRKRRSPVDQWYFELVIKAYGSRCCACGKHQEALKDPLQRGHIRLHSEDGSTEPENMIPVCLPCNKKYAKSDTPFKFFPEDWRERLAGLILLRLDPKYHVSVISGHPDVILKSKPVQNSSLINLQASDFGLPTDVYSWSPQHGLSPHEKQAAIAELTVTRARKLDPPPNHPSAKRQKEMREILDHTTRRDFLRVGDYYLSLKRWITPDNRFVQDSWGQFTEPFDFLRREMEQRAEEQKAVKTKLDATEARAKAEDAERRQLEAEDEVRILEHDKAELVGAVKAEMNRLDVILGRYPEAQVQVAPLMQLSREMELVQTREMLNKASATLDAVAKELDEFAHKDFVEELGGA